MGKANRSLERLGKPQRVSSERVKSAFELVKALNEVAKDTKELVGNIKYICIAILMLATVAWFSIKSTMDYFSEELSKGSYWLIIGLLAVVALLIVGFFLRSRSRIKSEQEELQKAWDRKELPYYANEEGLHALGEWLNSEDRIFLLMGEPGLGKTTFLKSLLNLSKESKEEFGNALGIEQREKRTEWRLLETCYFDCGLDEDGCERVVHKSLTRLRSKQIPGVEVSDDLALGDLLKEIEGHLYAKGEGVVLLFDNIREEKTDEFLKVFDRILKYFRNYEKRFDSNPLRVLVSLEGKTMEYIQNQRMSEFDHRKYSMQALSEKGTDIFLSDRLGFLSGWYMTKIRRYVEGVLSSSELCSRPMFLKFLRNIFPEDFFWSYLLNAMTPVRETLRRYIRAEGTRPNAQEFADEERHSRSSAFRRVIEDLDLAQSDFEVRNSKSKPFWRLPALTIWSMVLLLVVAGGVAIHQFWGNDFSVSTDVEEAFEISDLEKVTAFPRGSLVEFLEEIHGGILLLRTGRESIKKSISLIGDRSLVVEAVEDGGPRDEARTNEIVGGLTSGDSQIGEAQTKFESVANELEAIAGGN